MKKRKIAECINVRINVGNYQHIEITKYAEEEIEYQTQEDRISKESELIEDLIDSLKVSMSQVTKKMNMGIDEAIEVQESISKTIPEWLKNNPIPNIANKAYQSNKKNVSEQKQNKINNENVLSEVLIEDKPNVIKKEKNSSSNDDFFDEEDLLF